MNKEVRHVTIFYSNVPQGAMHQFKSRYIRKVFVCVETGHVAFEMYYLTPRGRVYTNFVNSFTTEEFALIMERVADVKKNPSIVAFNDVTDLMRDHG